MTYQVYERPRLQGYAATAATAAPAITTTDLATARKEARCIASFGLAAFVWDGTQAVYDPEPCGAQVQLVINDTETGSLF